MGAPAGEDVDNRLALTLKEVEGETAAEARLVARGYQDPDLRGGDVDAAGCVSRRRKPRRYRTSGAWILKKSYPGGWIRSRRIASRSCGVGLRG